MRVFNMTSHEVPESDTIPQSLPLQGFVWMAFTRREFELLQSQVQKSVVAWWGVSLHELHVQEFLNKQLTSHDDAAPDQRCGRGLSEFAP